jgi:hypothetical protein
VDADSWYCESSATRHITPNKQYFISYTKFAIPETIVLGKKNIPMQAYGQGLINIQMFHKGVWHYAILKDFVMCQIQVYNHSPSRQPPKTGIVHP